MSTKALIGTLAGIVLLMVVAYYAWPNPGKNVLRAEESAVNNAGSWRITTVVSRNSRPFIHRWHVAQCPDKEHILEEGPDDYSEYIRVGDDVYYRKNGMKWTKGTPGPDLFLPMPTPRPCLSNPAEPSSLLPGGAEEMRLMLESDAKDGHIEKGEAKQYKGSACQEWSISRLNERNQLGNYITCIGTDNLPRYMRSANEDFFIYFEWEPSLTIEVPDLNGTPAQWPNSL